MPEAALQVRLEAWRARVDAALAQALPSPEMPPRRLHAAMRHAVLLGGKRMRPLLVYAAGTAFGAGEASLDAPAAAVELIHAYSLVHDDLPAMDDDDLRRGQPTVHVAFDEATAILAGDALQSQAFAVLANAALPEAARAALCTELASAAAGMCAGQALDIDATGQASAFDIASLERLHALKTGALLRASVRMGAIAAGADEASRDALDRFANALGLAFQVRDDLLDVEGESATLGKTTGKDAARAKPTFPSLIGIEASRKRLDALAGDMRDALSNLPVDASALGELGRLAIERDR
ncbi:MAG: polyprenyl synthetase family protein [Thermomonas sp.]